MHIQANYSLLPYNTFKIDLKTQYYVEINRQSDILTLRTDIKLSSLPWRIIGDGSNLLFTQPFEGITIRCTFKQIKIVREDADNVWLSVGAGVKWHDLVTHTVEQGWWGLENLALIPGTVGAAPVQNIGAYGAEAQDVITRVQTLNIYDGQRRQFRSSECNFGYRTSIFKQEYVNKLLIHRVTFRLRKRHKGKANLVFEPLKKALKAYLKVDLTPKLVYDAVIKIREHKLPDHNIQGNAGSFFKNPVVDADYFNGLLKTNPDMPHHRMLDGSYKIPAAWLIEQIGWKGKNHGRAGVSSKHALFLVNRGGAKGSEIVELSQIIQEEVTHKFGIHLELEVIIL
ncbi:MAG: UDP-N-acetylmuramate dehydrogenase [Thiomicrorhabdus sp.]|nr:MAG: UDP-N-acetylmuramate dehydrogenase [Thiomicrorhabdus sp.]